MNAIPERFRRRVVAACEGGATYKEAAVLFGIGEATVNRILRRYREEGTCALRPPGSGRPRELDLEWLEAHALMEPDATLSQRADAWEAKSGVVVHLSTIGRGMQAIGWSHKKRRRQLANVTDPTSKPK